MNKRILNVNHHKTKIKIFLINAQLEIEVNYFYKHNKP